MSFINIALIAALGATVLSLGMGMVSLVKGGSFSKSYGTRAMNWRIIFQGAALAILAIALWVGK